MARSKKPRSAYENAGAIGQLAIENAGVLGRHAAEKVSDGLAWVAPRIESAFASTARAVAPKIQSAADSIRPRVQRASEQIAPLVRQAGDAVYPTIQQATESWQPLVSEYSDRIKHDYLPRAQAAVHDAGVALQSDGTWAEKAAKAGAVTKVALLTAPVKKRRCRKFRRALGIIAAIGAALGAVYYIWRQTQPQANPWAEEYWETVDAISLDDLADAGEELVEDVAAAGKDAVEKVQDAVEKTDKN